MTNLLSSKPARRTRRKSYEQRARMTGKAAKILAKAFSEKPTFHEDVDGNMIRDWKPSESSSYSNDDLRKWLKGQRNVEPETALEFVPPSAVKYCITKGWLRREPGTAGLWVTVKGAAELGLPPVRVAGALVAFVK